MSSVVVWVWWLCSGEDKYSLLNPSAGNEAGVG